ncbi:cytochrome b561 [Shimia isoporae]|uniref:Cytochrome b561 n=1 Tax=Shimia isoporae TaxID=647720 RepID=A0A4R1NLD7_9RHOB|nr:cytochrome b/b6 domain-containing protein [Shimia isoporae]TCL09176.1 cytochrome b561 [Shimia isoporae]
MSRTNTHQTYGSVAKTFHWLTALFILSALALGFIAHNAAYENAEQLAFKATLFSLHKTVGLAAFFTAVLRILWAFTQPRPKLLNGNHRVESLAAETAHWLLYGAMVLVPLTGWMHHASTTGFAPIWWPFGQSLPFVPKDPDLASTLGALHYSFMIVLVLTLLAHIGGALKHAIIDKDDTLARMLPGSHPSKRPPSAQPGHVKPATAAFAVWVLVFAFGVYGPQQETVPQSSGIELAEVQSGWAVESGTLGITVSQFGSEVSGRFGNWTADIDFDEARASDDLGSVTVQIAVDSLTLGSVTDQALGPDYLNAMAHPTAEFTAAISTLETSYVAKGNLTLNGQSVPLDLPFDLEIAGDKATMSGELVLDRRAFHVGDSMTDESSLGFSVTVSIALTANRGASNDNLLN